jgi:hypothetical protein
MLTELTLIRAMATSAILSSIGKLLMSGIGLNNTKCPGKLRLGIVPINQMELKKWLQPKWLQ